MKPSCKTKDEGPLIRNTMGPIRFKTKDEGRIGGSWDDRWPEPIKIVTKKPTSTGPSEGD